MSKSPFIGRQEELKNLKSLLDKPTASLVVVRGRRRIGKSRLIERFATGIQFIRFSGIPPTRDTDDQTQRDVFAQQLGSQMGLSGLHSSNWADLFTLLARHCKNGRVILLFDEISWMGSKDPTFLGKLKNAWDIEFSKNPALMLVLCGSVSTWIEANILNNTAFFGRISLRIHLEEFTLKECNALLIAQGFRTSPYEKFKLLSVTGGIPWYIEQLRPKLNADENIKNLCFNKDGILFNEFDLIFHDLFSPRNEIYKKAIEHLSKGPLEFKAIAKQLNYSKGGSLTEYLEHLIQAGFITRDYTWHLKTGKPSKLSHYRLSDNYLRFYLKYVARDRNRIQNNAFQNISMSSLPGWSSIMGLQFENLVLKNRRLVQKTLNIRAEDIVLENPYFQRHTERQAGCQFDYLIQTRFKTLFACEIKFSNQEIKPDVINEMKHKMVNFSIPNGFSCCPVLIHLNGVKESVKEDGYFVDIVDFGRFLE